MERYGGDPRVGGGKRTRGREREGSPRLGRERNQGGREGGELGVGD